MKEIIDAELFPGKNSKYKVSLIIIEHTKSINRKAILDFLSKQGKTVKIITYKNARIDSLPTNSLLGVEK